MPVKDGSTSRARLVDGGCISFENRRSEKICRETREQEISAQTWRIPREKININVLQDGVEENVGVYAKGWGNMSLCRQTVRYQGMF